MTSDLKTLFALLLFVQVISFHKSGVNQRALSSVWPLKCQINDYNDGNPYTRSNKFKFDIQRVGKSVAVALGSWFSLPYNSNAPRSKSNNIFPKNNNVANAIGNLYEFQTHNLIFQDITFNVQNTEPEFEAMNALCLNTFKKLREYTDKKDQKQKIICGFGSDDYFNPKSFYPGISTFSEDGGHATITFQSQLDRSTNRITRTNKRYGNYSPSEVKYIKIGTEVLRISKGVEKGMNVKYAYGWIDVDSPSNVPYEVVLGITRDPLMMLAIEVLDIQLNEKFFVNTIGMKRLPFPLARSPGSQYEATQPPDSVHLGFGPDLMSLLLIPKQVNVNKDKKFTTKTLITPSSPPVASSSSLTSTNTAPVLATIGSSTTASTVTADESIPLLDSITIVYDDNTPLNNSSFPELYQTLVTNSSKVETILYSPDGLRVRLKPYSLHKNKK